MKQFLKNSALFVLFTMLIICLLQALVSFRINNKAVTGYDNWDATKNVNADLVLLGSSRCWAQLDPAFFEDQFKVKTINIGINGHSELSAILLRLKNYLAKNKAPQFAILSFDPLVTPGSFENNYNFTNKDNYARFAFLTSKENLELVNYFKFTYPERYIPLYALFKYQLVENCVTMKDKDLFKEGFELNDNEWDTLKYPISDIMKKHFVNNSQINQLKVQLQLLKSLCKTNNIRLLCLQTPVYKSLYDKTVFDRSKAICKSVNIPLVDVSSGKIQDSIGNFYNSTHLNKKGVAQMNNLLKNEKELTSFFKINP